MFLCFVNTGWDRGWDHADTVIIVTAADALEWPKYSLEDPRNMVFNVNVTNLAYAEPDTFRAKGIKFLIENLDGVFHQ